MSIDNPVFISKALAANANLSSYQHYLVELSSTANQVSVCNAASDIPLGSLYNKPTAQGQAAEIAAPVPGTVIKVKVASGGVTAGWVGTDSSGLLTNKTTDKDFVIGRVLQSWDSGDLAEVLCMPCFLAA